MIKMNIFYLVYKTHLDCLIKSSKYFILFSIGEYFGFLRVLFIVIDISKNNNMDFNNLFVIYFSKNKFHFKF